MMAINPIIVKLEIDYEIISYADDILIAADIDKNPTDIINYISDLLKDIGLEVNLEKCHSTKNGELKFM